MIIHFICRGNAFRSIIAETYLKSLEIQGVEVVSSGTVASANKEFNIAVFPRTLAMLDRHGVAKYVKDHIADDVTQEKLDKSDVVVIVNQRAYDEAAAKFILPEKTYVWDITDIGEGDRIANTDEEREPYLEEVYQEIVDNMAELRKVAGF